MYLKNQQWIEQDKHIVLKLYQPYWGAWKQFNWAEGTEGLSVSMEAIKYCLAKKKKLKVIVTDNKYGTFEITPTMALSKGKITSTSNGTVLVCIPRTAYKKVEEKKKPIYEYHGNVAKIVGYE